MTIEDTIAYFTDTKKAFQQTFEFTQPANLRVLEKLAKFCRANESTFHPDARIAANLDGRREVWLLIQKNLNLSPEQIAQLSVGNSAAVYERLSK
jgi:hypothetical protein